MSDSSQPHELQPTRLLRPWDFPDEEYWSGLPLPCPTNQPSEENMNVGGTSSSRKTQKQPGCSNGRRD